MRPLPRPMLLRSGPIPTGTGWIFELKYDGYRAVVSTEDRLRVRSRRGWDMSDRVRELQCLPPNLVLDGELVAFNEIGAPHWRLLGDRVLHGNGKIPVRVRGFDVLRMDGHDLTRSPWSARRAVLEELGVDTDHSRITDVFDDGQVLFDAVCEHGLEGIVAKKRTGAYRPGQRGWVGGSIIRGPNIGRVIGIR